MIAVEDPAQREADLRELLAARTREAAVARERRRAEILRLQAIDQLEGGTP